MSEWAKMPYSPILLSDFRDAVLLPTRDFAKGFDPYNSAEFLVRHPGTQGYSPYTPGHLLLGLPLVDLSWSVSTAWWTALLTVALAATGAVTGLLAIRVWRPAADPATRLLAAGLGVLGIWVARTTTLAIGLGQPSTVYGAAMGLTVALLALHVSGHLCPRTITGQRLLTASTALLSAVAMNKPAFVIGLILVAITLRAYRSLLLGLILAAIASLAVALRLAGSGSAVPTWVLTLPQRSVSEAPSRFDSTFVTNNPWMDIGSMAFRLGGGPLEQNIAMATVIVLGTLAARRLAARVPLQGALLATLTGCLGLPHGWYDAMVLIPLSILCLGGWLRSEIQSVTAAVAVGLVILAQLVPTRFPIAGTDSCLLVSLNLLAAWTLLMVISARPNTGAALSRATRPPTQFPCTLSGQRSAVPNGGLSSASVELASPS